MIQGVVVQRLRTFEDERGYFREIFRFSEPFADLSIGQLSHSLVKEGVVKAWHGHVYQSQWNYVISGSLRVALHDNRNDSPTYGNTVEFFTGDGHPPSAYFFPPGVLHGYQCIRGPMHIVYVTSGVYDLEDEVRVAKENLEYVW